MFKIQVIGKNYMNVKMALTDETAEHFPEIWRMVTAGFNQTEAVQNLGVRMYDILSSYYCTQSIKTVVNILTSVGFEIFEVGDWEGISFCRDEFQGYIKPLGNGDYLRFHFRRCEPVYGKAFMETLFNQLQSKFGSETNE